MPKWQFINFLLIGFGTLISAESHFERHKTGEAWFLLFMSVLMLFWAFYYRKRGVPQNQFERGSPFCFFTKWDWETPPSGWRKAILTLAWWAWLFGLIAVVFPITMIVTLPMASWFFYQPFRILKRIQQCQARQAPHVDH